MTDATDTINGVPVARRIPLRGIQRVVASRTLAGIQSTAHVTAMAEVDAEPILAHARELREAIPGLTLTHLLIKTAAVCLRRHPRLNATIEEQTVIEYAEVNVAVALALPSDDLVAVVIRRADQRSLAEIVTGLQTLHQRAEAGALSAADVQCATFTLSNYGMLRTVTWATPVLTPGQAAVLGIGRAAPRMVEDEADPRGFSVRRVLPISLTYDHRIVNGVPAGRFLDDLAEVLQQPGEPLRQ
ncbi:MAG TPA: 2-oxo acid dehydrogenase subunit E2 [Candidatus Binatia bacterium]|nr:2-oxo acid dehydrogenase subunit E2 [Candidatus Binatia bacterium]